MFYNNILIRRVMKKINFLNFSLLAILLVSCGSTTSIKKDEANKSSNEKKLEQREAVKKALEIELKDKLVYLKGEKKPYTGKYSKYYENGKVKTNIFYKDGILEGKAIMWHKNGQKKQEGSYKNGLQEGKLTTWFKNGNKKQEGF